MDLVSDKSSAILAMIAVIVMAIGFIGTFAETNGNPPKMPESEMGQPPEDMDDPGGNSGPGGDADKAAGVIGFCSFSGREDYEYDAALYVTGEGIDGEKSSTDRVAPGEYDASDADGSDTCDFSGRGSAITVCGTESSVSIEDSIIHTSGVATMPVFVDDGATVAIRYSTLQSDGGTLNAEYKNTYDQALIVAPPWILGIMGTSCSTNMMGDNTTTNVIDNETSADA